ncbi:alpha/beta-hydrolase [Xylaria palmicola]|nr:alpha/beta-hydrolase [Xylaria palmicola]
MGLFSRKKPAEPSSGPRGNFMTPSAGQHNDRTPYSPATNPSSNPFQSVGALPHPPPPPYAWNDSRPAGPPAPAPAPAPFPSQDPRHYAPIIVNQHYYLNPHQSHPCLSNVYPTNRGAYTSSNLRLGSTSELIQMPANVINQFVDDGLPRWHAYGTQLVNQSAALYDRLSSKFDDVMTSIDRDKFVGNENDLFMYQQPSQAASSPPDPMHHPVLSKGNQGKKKARVAPKGQTSAVAASLITTGYFAKVDLYANSRLPLDLPPLRVPIPIYPLLCLAAQYAERVYEQPRGAERDAHVNADWKTGTKAMYIKSVPMDRVGVIVFAIRGTATFMDWAVNLNTAPTAPTGFLDDARNFCHAGFLSVARKMIAPVASRLRQLLEEDPGRCAYSLLITGHSAGGAIASLLYMHMLAKSKSASSELNLLTGCFKKIHCITFGAPPVSLFPLQTPHRHELRKSLFYSFVNEGDPVTRADKAYVRSLLELFAAPAPTGANATDSTKSLVAPVHPSPKPNNKLQEKNPKPSIASKTARLLMKPNRSPHPNSSAKRNNRPLPRPVWRVPPSALSNAGRIVVLRSSNPHAKVKRTKTIEERLEEGVVAQVASDEKLRGLIWGDPVCHVMRLYAARIEMLAIGAVTAKGH